MTAYTLSPCPFCGGEAELLAQGVSAMVRCTSCGASIAWQRRPDAWGPVTEVDMAVGAWNARTHNATATHAGKAQPFICTDDVPEEQAAPEPEEEEKP